MTVSKKNSQFFSRRTADPLFDFEEPYIQAGIISGQSYTAAQVSNGFPKPSYLQLTANSNIITISASIEKPLRLIFPLGIHTANTGGTVGAYRTYTAKATSNTLLTPSSNVNSWIFASINQNGSPNQPSSWTVEYYTTPSTGRNQFWQTATPAGVTDGDIWFDIANNVQKVYSTAASAYQQQDRVYLGEVGIGTNGYAYTLQSWYPNYGYAKFVDSQYVYEYNPQRNYDGVSFLTDGLYTAGEINSWANNNTILQALATSNIAMQAIANNSSVMQIAANNSNAMTFFVNTSTALTAITSNTTAVRILANSAIAQSAILSSNANSALIAISNSASALTGISNNSQTILLHRVMMSNSHYTTIINDANLRNIVANSTTGPITATGGNTVSTIVDGGVTYRVHQFTGVGTLAVHGIGSGSTQAALQYLVIAGGGGAGVAVNNSGTGGSGAGGYRTNVPGQTSGRGSPAEGAFTATKTSYLATVGAGGVGRTGPVAGSGNRGSNSSFSSVSTIGGGYSGGFGNDWAAVPGGSGGGGSGGGNNQTNASLGTTAEGFDGGAGAGANPAGGGGGGAGAVGGAASPNFPPAGAGLAGTGGAGLASPITGTPVTRAGGGGGGTQGYQGYIRGPGGAGGGGQGEGPTSQPAGPSVLSESGSTNTGGGSGGVGGSQNSGGSGGSGIVIVRYAVSKV